MNLEKFRLKLTPAPDRILALVKAGVVTGTYPADDNVVAVLDGPTPPAEGVWRANDGRVLIVCNTDMPYVTPAMIDWWFGWHLPSSERYQLWHPTAHVACRVREDRSHLPVDRQRYIGNASHVDEYIGRQLRHLTITFIEPARLGFTDLDARGATAICGITGERALHADGGHLCHLLIPTATGCQMRSGFWLGDIRHHWGIVRGLFSAIYNTAFARKLAVSDTMSVDLLQHCSEEMNHLARFLPTLYRDAHQDECHNQIPGGTDTTAVHMGNVNSQNGERHGYDQAH